MVQLPKLTVRVLISAACTYVFMPLRTLHFGPHDEGLVTFLVYPPDDLVLVVRIQWLGD